MFSLLLNCISWELGLLWNVSKFGARRGAVKKQLSSNVLCATLAIKIKYMAVETSCVTNEILYQLFGIAFVGNWVCYGMSVNLAADVGLGRNSYNTSNVMCRMIAIKIKHIAVKTSSVTNKIL